MSESQHETAKPIVLEGTRPVTLELATSPVDLSSVRAAIEGRLSKEKSIRLTLEDVTPPENSITGIMVFFNHPMPTKTTADSPYFVGAIAFSHRENTKPQTFHLNLNRALQRLPRGALPASQSTRITLAATPIRRSDDITKARITIRNVKILVSSLETQGPASPR